jgi:magnesium transporter
MVESRSHTDAIRTQTHNGVTWLDVQNPNSDVLAQLEKQYHLHPQHLNESIQKVQHNQVEREDNYLFFVLHFPTFADGDSKIVIGQLGIFLGKDFMATVRTSDCPVVNQLYTLCKHDAAQAELTFDHGPDHLLYSLISKLLSSISDMTDVVVTELDGIEDVVFDNTGSDAHRIGKVRQKIVRLRRVIGPKRLILEDLCQQIDSFMGGRKIARYYATNTKRVNKLWEVIEEAKETVEIYKDADFITSTEKTNQILMVLTLVFTFTIPITIVGALYGMNVLLPGGIETGNWSFLGRYTTFELLVAGSLGLAIGMFVYFKFKKWF